MMPPPALESVEQMALFLKGPPRVNVYELREKVVQVTEKEGVCVCTRERETKG